jgi:ribosomal protein L37AE/L43A
MTDKVRHLCPNCHTTSVTIRFSRYINERCVSNFWSCEACEYEAETSPFFSDTSSREVMVYHVG